MSDKPLFSILIATRNCADLLPRCLDSIARQDFAATEILVADGGSTDGTVALLEDRAADLAYWHSRPDSGPYDAWNALLPRIEGRWVMFLGADDRLAGDDTLSRLADACARLPDRAPRLDYVYGLTEFLAEGKAIEEFGTPPPSSGCLDLTRDLPFSHTGLLHHRDLFVEFGNFPEDYAIAGDAYFVLRSARDPRTRFHHVPIPVARMAAGGLSSSVRSRLACYREVEQARRSLAIEPVRPRWLASLQRRSAWAARIHALLGERGLLLAANAYRRLTGRTVRNRYR